MWTYIVRRLMLMVVTLFGITLVTYCIMTLTPGDPAQMAIQAEQQAGGDKGTLSREDIERIRAQFGLDKPPFLNFEPTDREVYLRRRLEDYGEDDEDIKRKLPVRLRELGAAGLDPAFRILEEAEASGTEEGKKLAGHVVTSLTELASALAKAPSKEPGLDAAGWKQWWVENQESLAGARAAVDAAAQAKDYDRIAEIRKVHCTLAVEHLMPWLDDEDVERRRWTVQALATLASKPSWTVDRDAATDDPATQEDLDRWVYRWGSWWRSNGVQFRDLGVGESALAVITETQYGTWMMNLARGDLGESTYYHKPVMEILPARIEVTLMLSVLSIILAYIIAIPLGIFSASNPYTLTDKVLTTILFILYSLPTFWVGNLLILFFTGGHDFPTNFPYASTSIAPSALDPEMSSADQVKTWIHHVALPLFCFTYGSFAYLSRQMRASMMETIRADFIRTARAKGLSERVVVFKHALRNSLIPILTIMANILPRLIGGSVIIETIFTVDGMGELVFRAVFNRDYPIVMAVGFFSAVLTLVGILISDLSYALVDPRITYD